ncbi:MAG TPA: hypothetical protein VE986_06300 [Hyphomicrobiales bacterium]|nr:hypothetical protein [Hyphomicrobiales bacterium]
MNERVLKCRYKNRAKGYRDPRRPGMVFITAEIPEKIFDLIADLAFERGYSFSRQLRAYISRGILECEGPVLEATQEIQIPPPDSGDPVARAIRFAMAKRRLRQIDLVDICGAQSRISEIVNGRRPVPKSLAAKLADRLQIPVQVLLIPEEAANWNNHGAHLSEGRA